MDEKLRKRLIGAAVLMSLLVIFVPMLIERQNEMILEVEDISEPNDILPGLENVKYPDSFPPPVELSDAVSETVEEVVKEEPVEAAGPLDAWALQLASFSSQARADSLMQKLRKKGYICYSERVLVKGKTLYRVRVGPEIDRSRLVVAKQKLQKQFKLTGKIIRHKR